MLPTDGELWPAELFGGTDARHVYPRRTTSSRVGGRDVPVSRTAIRVRCSECTRGTLPYRSALAQRHGALLLDVGELPLVNGRNWPTASSHEGRVSGEPAGMSAVRLRTRAPDRRWTTRCQPSAFQISSRKADGRGAEPAALSPRQEKWLMRHAHDGRCRDLCLTRHVATGRRRGAAILRRVSSVRRRAHRTVALTPGRRMAT